ncbi:MAG: AI-2E family transporter [bacterium]|nr:AI-2E family transporter [bacterium]
MSNEIKESSDLVQIKIFVGFIAAVIAVVILKQLKNIFIPLCMALLLYFFFNGVVKKMLRLKIPKVLVLSFLLIFIFIMFYFLGVMIYTSVDSFIEKFPEYGDQIKVMVNGIENQLKSVPFLDKYFKDLDWADLAKSIDPSAVTAIITTTFGDFAAFIGNLLLVLIFLMFMLAGRNALTDRVHKAFEDDRADKIKFIINSIEDQVQHYLLIKTFVSFLTAFISAIILSIMGMDLILFSALMIFVLNFIPNIGSFIATLIPVFIAILKFGFNLKVAILATLLVTIQFVIGNAVEPKITGKSLNLSPLVILVSLIFWGYIWGVVGMILAVPLTSAIKIFFQHIPVLKPIAELISAE